MSTQPGTVTHPERELVLVEADGHYRVHAPGCSDIRRDENYEGNPAVTEHVRDMHDLVLAVWGPNMGSYFLESDQTILDWQDWTHNFQIKPCVGNLPHDIPEITTDDRAARYGDDRDDL